MTLPLQTIEKTPGATKLQMGDAVTFHHRAGVARWKKMHPDLPEVGWKITMGVNQYDTLYPDDPLVPEFNGSRWNHIRYVFAEYPRVKMGFGGSVNKTVMVWPQEGTGWIVGKIRKSIGISEKGYSNTYNGEYEPGYHSSMMHVDLFIVKPQFYGTAQILCPTWAVQRREDG